MTDQLHTNATQRGLLGFLGKIAGPKGFFGSGFWADFKEGWDKTNPNDKAGVPQVDSQFSEKEPNSAYDPKIYFDHYNHKVIYSFFQYK